jgi:hypothetical protein
MGEANKKNKQKIIKPQPKQQSALMCPAYELLFGGARGEGKTLYLLLDFLKDTMEKSAVVDYWV